MNENKVEKRFSSNVTKLKKTEYTLFESERLIRELAIDIILGYHDFECQSTAE